MLRALAVITAASRRYLKLDLKYRFELTVNASILMANVVSFGIMGGFVVASNRELVSYPYHLFLLTGIFYWTVVANGLTASLSTLYEETERGAIGFFLSNGVSPAVITLSRMVVTTIEALGLSIITAVPAMLILSGGTCPAFSASPSWALGVLVSTALPWLFMLSVAISLTAVQLVFKRIGGLAGAVHYVLGVVSGLYFPPQAIPVVGDVLAKLPTAVGLRAFRELLVFGEARGLKLSLEGLVTPLTDGWMLVFTTLASLAASLVLLAKVERLTMKWGTIEQY
ncbi:MAG: hypothetical protein N3H31_01515 [Candidatus Nezhaarchaeota archaeon]|nr:hypothetical protein [Candidatus Nezhaarchaeota archaeon]